MKKLFSIAVWLMMCLGAMAQGQSLYASAPRFRALLVYDPSAEPDHVTFDEQAIDFFHHLSYGEGFLYDVTTTLDTFSLEKMQRYDVLVMLNAQPGRAARDAFEQYMEQGGGWLGFHASAFYNEQSDWEWYHAFLGCGPFLCNNWPPQPALLTCDSITTTQFITQPPYQGASLTANLPASFVCPASEYYQWYPSPRVNPDVEVYLTLSPRNYPLGIKDIIYSGDMPVVWSNRKYRMLYINMGHGDQSFIDPTQNLLFTNALRWVVAPVAGLK